MASIPNMKHPYLPMSSDYSLWLLDGQPVFAGIRESRILGTGEGRVRPTFELLQACETFGNSTRSMGRGTVLPRLATPIRLKIFQAVGY